MIDNLDNTVDELSEREEADEIMPRHGKSSIINSDLAERRTMAKSDLMKSDTVTPSGHVNPRAPMGSPKVSKEGAIVEYTDSVVSAMTPLLKNEGKVSPRI